MPWVVGKAIVLVRDQGKFLDLRLWEPQPTKLRMALSIELVAGVGLFVFAVLCAIAFFRRKRIFPFLFVLNFGALFLYAVSDGLIVAQLGNWTSEQSAKLLGSLIQIIGAASIWVPYMFVSRRVRATFTECNRTVDTPAEPPPLVALQST